MKYVLLCLSHDIEDDIEILKSITFEHKDFVYIGVDHFEYNSLV